ncbi:adhesion G protein-coupled receptor G3-like [Corythoichthys intestinalis]|uniref:adhesion G protein-coupled receptor G3-like n=1 Tax=Corythoichthys intestinalis TaxID=161448 RepID=UPI0025A4DB5F|nr:adhesion G protein-coupled receptor G3-like [Corythoichthys intestinalis]
MRALLIWLLCNYAAQACLESNASCPLCKDVFSICQEERSWTRCYKKKIVSCTSKGRGGLIWTVDPSKESVQNPTQNHSVHIPSSALQKSRESGDNALVVVTVLDSTYFKPTSRNKGRTFLQVPTGPTGTVLGRTVLVVQAGSNPLQNLPEPVTLTFKYNETVVNGTCVFWEDEDNGSEFWSTYGCNTSNTGSEFVCHCNHLSFFAVLVNPDLSLSKEDAFNLSFITYFGSALSVVFSIISLILYACLNKRQPDRAIGLHTHLTVALLCLHSCFLLSCWWAERLAAQASDWLCGALGLVLHWSLLATVCWSALEGFHLYLLLVRVFNIYVRRYLLKLSVLGWGVPTLIALACGVSGVYGKYTLDIWNSDNSSSTTQLCWMSNSTRSLVTYVTTAAFPCLVVVFNSCMLGLVVLKLWRLRGSGGAKSDWEKVNRLWKDCVTVLGLSCVLGLPFGLLTFTYVSIPAIYVFTALNSLQGVFVFLWSLALLCKSQSDTSSSSKDTSTQKIMTTSFNS